MSDSSERIDQLSGELDRARNRITELESAVSDLKQREDCLRTIADTYNRHFSLTNDVLYALDTQLKIRTVSPSVENALGYRPDELIGKSLREIGIIHPEDIDRATSDTLRMLSGKKTESSVYRFFNGRGEIRFGEVRGIPLMDGARITGVVAVARDVTGRIKAQEELRRYRDQLEELVRERTTKLTKLNESLAHEIDERTRTEESLRMSEEKYRQLVENASEGIFVVQDGMLRYVNPKISEISGYSREELTSEPFDVFIHPDDLPEVMDRHRRRMQGEVLTDDYTFRVTRKSGEIRWIEVHAVPITWEGRPAALTFVVDVTESMRIENALRASEAKYRMLYDGMVDGFIIADLTGRILEFNEPYRKMTGYDPDELRRLTYMDLTPPIWHGYETEILNNQTLVRGYSEPYQKEYVRKDGTVFPIELRTYLLNDEEGNPKAMWATVRDITERKHAEEALRESEARLRGIAENLPGAVYQFYARDDGELGLYYISERTKEILGLDNRPGDFLERFTACIAHDERDGFLDSIRQKVRSSANWNYEVRFITPEGKEKYIRGISRPRRVGNELIFDGVLLDVTEQRQAETALRESERRFRDLAENTSDLIWETDAQLRFTYMSQKVREQLGYGPEDRVGRTLLDVIPGEDSGRLRPFMLGLMESPRAFQNLEYTALHQDGSVRVREASGVPIYDGEGRHVGYRGVTRDITERRRAEERTQASEKKFSTLFHSSPVPMVLSLPQNGMIIDCNLSSERWSGYSHEELVGHTTVELGFWVDTYDRECLVNSVSEHYLSEATEVMFRIKDGSIHSVLFSSRLIDVDGTSLMLTQLIDVTERKETEQRIQASERKFSAAFNSSPAPMVITSFENGTIMDANQACQEWSGYTLTEAIGRTTTEMGFWQEPNKRAAFIHEIMDKGTVDGLEMKYINRSGEARDVLHSARLIEIDGRQCLLSHVQDITEKKKAEKALIESEERLRGIADNFPGVVFQFYARDNGETGVYYISERTREILGLENTIDLFLDKALACISPEDRERFHASVNKAIHDEIAWNFVCRFMKPGGEEIFVQGISQPVRHQHELIFSGVLFDITSQKQLDEELKRYREHLEEMVLSRTTELTNTMKILTQEIETRKKTESTLRFREMELRNRGTELEEMNAALKILLRQREEDRSAMEMNIISNMKTFVLPHVEKLEATLMEDSQVKSVSMIRTHLEEITSPFTRRISSEFLGLTPAEIQVASLIREGKTSKDIARMLNISLNTVHTYRYNIRKKTGLKNNKVNLRSYLKTLE